MKMVQERHVPGLSLYSDPKGPAGIEIIKDDKEIGGWKPPLPESARPKSTGCPKTVNQWHVTKITLTGRLENHKWRHLVAIGFTCSNAPLECLQLPISLFCSHELVRGIYS